jgi:hypothetical protein
MDTLFQDRFQVEGVSAVFIVDPDFDYPQKLSVFIVEWLSTATSSSHLSAVGLLVDSEIVFSTRHGKTRVFINKTLSTETAYQQAFISRDLVSTSFNSW